MKRKKYGFRIVYGIVLVLVLFWPNLICGDGAPEQSDLNALSAVVMEAESGRILYDKNGSEPRAMASTTKIMTLTVALENGNLSDMVSVSANAAQQPEVNMNLREGETFVLEDLLYALMLQSYNDVAVAVAEHVGGSVENFCAMMTEKAQEIGAKNTCFKTPSGLDAEGHQTTAADLALITAYAVQNETFMKIVGTQSYEIQQNRGNSRSVSLSNKNPLLTAYPGATGGKTGFTSQAGLCLVGIASRDGVQLISVVLGSGWPPHSQYRIADTKKLLDYGFLNYTWKTVPLDGKDTQEAIEVSRGTTAQVGTKIEGDFKYFMKDDDQLEIHYDLPYVLEAPVEAGEVVGEATVYVDGKAAHSLPVVTAEGSARMDFTYFLHRVLEGFFHTEVQM
ncbi:MAG: D-alanyl-D-alanine carboxypeptidase family protein [Clostridia bacterium]